MKVFDNERTQINQELPLRKGTVVPEGAVNLAWQKAPELNPANHMLVVDASRAEGPSKTGIQLAYANALGILEDESGNQVWPEEYPIVGNQFLDPTNITGPTSFLPYVHISRYFHVDYVGLGYSGSLTELDDQPEVKVVDARGKEYLDDNGNKRYSIHVVAVDEALLPENSLMALYRLWVFLDMEPEEDELFLTYHKAELDNTTKLIRDEVLGYKETLSADEYFSYHPEESFVVDQSSSDKNIYSTKPIDLKDQVLGRSQPNYKGWTIQVPKKAIPDPRKYEVFRWRPVCEYIRDVDAIENGEELKVKTKMKVGVVSYNTNFSGQSRASYLFRQLNDSNFNIGGLDFINPLQEGLGQYTKDQAAYWAVPISTISNEDLSQFDVLLWSAPARDIDVGTDTWAKIEHFTEVLGGTFIFETCSRADFTGIPSITFSPRLISVQNPATADAVEVTTISYYDEISATPSSATPDTTPTAYGMWDTWPIDIESLMTDYGHSAEVLQNMNDLGGWDLNTAAEQRPSCYMNLSGAASLRMQYITSWDYEDWEIILDAKKQGSSAHYPIMLRKRFNSGGSIFVSTASIFEDHIIDPTDIFVAPIVQIQDLGELSPKAKKSFALIDSPSMEGEMKLRFNTLLLATAFKPPSSLSPSSAQGYSEDYEKQSITVYGDWQSSWVINAHNGVLSDEEKAEYNFALLPKNPEDPDPVWMRLLSQKTMAQIMEAKVKELDPEGTNPTYRNLNGLKHRYGIMVSNPSVETYTFDLIDDNTIPAVWTYSYSPKFTIPVDIGPHIIRDELIAGTGVGDGRRYYPPKPYKIQSKAAYQTSSSNPNQIPIKITFTGTARMTYKMPDVTKTIPAPPYQRGWEVDKYLRWNTDNYNGLEFYWGGNTSAPIPQAYDPERRNLFGTPLYWGLDTWSDANYRRARTNNWPYYGMHGHYRVGMGDRYGTSIIQKMINQCIFWGVTSGPYLAEDGIFGSATAARVRTFQANRGAQYIDGIVDAETWSLLGYAMIAIDRGLGFKWAPAAPLAGIVNNLRSMTRLSNMSDLSDGGRAFTKASWIRNGPGTIRESFQLTFSPAFSELGFSDGGFDVYELIVQPFMPSHAQGANSMVIDWLDVGMNLGLRGYKYSRASHGNVNIPVRAGQYTRIPFSPRRANSVIFRLRQTQAAGWGSARVLGVQDAALLAKQYIVNQAPPQKPQVVTVKGATVVAEVKVEVTYNLTLFANEIQTPVPAVKNNVFIEDVRITSIDGAKIPTLSQYPDSISEINFTSYKLNPADKASVLDIQPVVISAYGKPTYSTFKIVYNGVNPGIGDPNYVVGPKIGDGSSQYYVKPVAGQVDPFPRSYGWITKDQGILLICDEDGKPFGFPPQAPSAGAGKEAHFVKLTVDSWETDQTLLYGFYDTRTNEWVENPNGEPNISYYEYIRRGVDNVYLAVQTTYEFDSISNLPSPTDPVIRPFKQAMPVYGIKLRNESTIKIQQPNPELGLPDIWPINVSTGGFTRKLPISQEFASTATNYLRSYANKDLTAYYLLRQSTAGPWSNLMGRPYRDTVGEQPRLLSDTVIKVNNAPIAQIQEPTEEYGPADPVTPLFKVYIRDTVSDPWQLVPMEDIKDYNLNMGTITLENPIPNQDKRLVKVDYTAKDYTYHFKYQGLSKINLNPFVLRRDNPNWLDKPLYVYVRPAYVVDNETKNIIAASKSEQPLGISLTSTIFDAQHADYDPTLYLLGIVVVSSSSSIEDLTIIDTRVRGGGAKHHLELKDLNSEADSYWDDKTQKPYSYQQGGFVVIKLPAEVVGDFVSETDLRRVIDRNITSGVAYELQDYDGNPLFGDPQFQLLSESGEFLTTEDGEYLTWVEIPLDV